MASIEVTASDVESAIEQGLSQLGLMRADVKIEILEEGSRGVLGLGARQAKIRLTPYEEIAQPPAPAAADAQASADDDEGEYDDDEDFDEDEADYEDGDEEESEDQADGDADDGEPAPVIEGEGLAVEFTQTILERMGFRRATATGRSLLPMDDADQPSIVVDIDVEERDEEAFLSHNAEALNALQTIVQTMWSHKTKSNVRVNLDVNGYKARRQEKLMNMARRMAERVVESGRPIMLEPMPAIDRRIVHMALRDHPSVFTESAGEGASRKVQIKPKLG
jgi:spoIIIJ-associated protein